MNQDHDLISKSKIKILFMDGMLKYYVFENEWNDEVFNKLFNYFDKNNSSIMEETPYQLNKDIGVDKKMFRKMVMRAAGL